MTAASASCNTTGGIDPRHTFEALQELNTCVNAQFGSLATSGTGTSIFSNVLFTVAYTLSTAAITNGVRIDPPSPDGGMSSPQTIRGFVSTPAAIQVPEPSSLMLLAAGLFGLGVMVRRRQNA